MPKEQRKGRGSMSKVEDIIAASKLSELMNKKEEDKHGKTVLWILAVVGAVAAVAGIAYAVYCFFTPDYLEDFDDDLMMMISTMTFSMMTIRYKNRADE